MSSVCPACASSRARLDNVVFQKVQFQWYPQWIAVFACVPLLMAIMAAVLTRRTKGELPFSQPAWEAWKKGKLIFGFSILGALVLFFAGMFALGSKMAAVGGIMMVAAIVEPIVVFRMFLRGRGPRCTKIDKGLTHLKLPSAAAAEKIRQHLSAGKSAAPVAAR